jgi:hypothetical protein
VSKFSLQRFANSVGLPFRDLLPESTIIETLEAEKVKYRNRLFNLIVTLWAFLSQVLDTDKSLQNAVSRIIAWLAAAGAEIPAADTGGYSKARKRLPEKLLLKLFYSKLVPGDVVLADRAFGTYVDLVLVQQYSADAVFRKHQSRKSDFRRGKKLGIGDHIVTWSKPKRCPPGMSQEEFAELPEQVRVREVHMLIQQKGFRPKEIIVVTTLLESKVYTKAKLAQLYQWRWQVEVDLRQVKTTLGMEMLRGKTPDMVRKEIYVHLMAYNLLRTVMWQAGKKAGVCPMCISLQGTRQHFANFCPELYKAGAKKRLQLYNTLLTVVTDKLLPERPYRYEPRLKKQRPKPYGWMQQPRNVFKRKLAA